jgi:hypothetical protein
MNNSKIKATRFPSLGYTCEAAKQWTIVDKQTSSPIGPKYTSKEELLADLPAFAEERGYDN